jgi:hypothetical protein
VNQSARCFTKVLIAFLLTELLNICRFKQDSQRHGCASCTPENLSTFIALYVAFTFLVSTPPSILSARIFVNGT